MTGKHTKQFIQKLCKKHHKLLESWEVETTGLHIHVSRNSLTKMQIGKILVFINHPKNRDLVNFIARRENRRYARLSAKKITDCYDNSPECHYNAINTNKNDTIEFRIFRGSINYETVISYLEFVIAVIEFITVSSSEKLENPNDFLDWLNSTNESQFRSLKKRLLTIDDKSTSDRDWETVINSITAITNSKYEMTVS